MRACIEAIFTIGIIAEVVIFGIAIVLSHRDSVAAREYSNRAR